MKQYNYIYRSSEDFERYIKSNSIDVSSPNILIQMFTSVRDPSAISNIAKSVTKKFPNAVLIGSSTAGEITEGVMYEGVTVLSISCFDRSRVEGFYVQEKNSNMLGFMLGREAFTKDTKCLITFLDGLEHNGQEFLDGLSSLNTNKAIIAGGMAADGLYFEKTYTIFGSEVFSGGAVCATLMGEDLLAYEEYNLGWKAVGPTFTITKSEGARVYEINNRPVKEVYAEVLGDLAVENMPASTIEFPLIYERGELQIARSMLSVCEDGSILYGGDLCEGEEVRFGIGSRNLVNKFTLKDELQEKQEDLQACFIYSCIARKQFLQRELEQSFRLVNAIAPSSGFFTYGEFFVNEGQTKLLNVTTTMLFLYEKGTQKQKRRQSATEGYLYASKTDSALFNLIDYVTLELQRQEREFRASKFKLDEFLKALDATVIISRTDTEGVITYVNERFEEISGYTKEELIGKPHRIVREPSVSNDLFKDMWQTITKGKIWHGEFANRAKDGSVYYVKSSIIPIHDEHNNIVEYMSIREDVTSLVESRKKAQKAEAAQAKFLANMSHEIRTPMNGILGFSELLAKTNLDEKQHKYVSVITKSTELLLNIVNDILDSSKLSSQKIVLEERAMNPFEEFRTTFELLEPLAKEKDLHYSLEIDKALSECLVSDALRLRQVMTNLLSNAIKFTHKGGSVKLNIRLIESKNGVQKVHFCVQDDGIGIAKEKLTAIFEPFSQADDSTTRKFGGTGLGLSISSELLKAFGSSLEVISKEGEGSRFFFNLSLKECSSVEQKSATHTQKRSIPALLEPSPLMGRVLIVEDYDVNRLLIESLFEKYPNIHITFAHNGKEALVKAEQQVFDLILMDINMPVLNGMEATEILQKEMGITTPVVALTANVLSDDKERYFASGMSDYLSKPIDISELDKVLSRYLQQTKAEATLIDIAEYFTRLKQRLGLDEATAGRLLATFVESLKEFLPALEVAMKKQDTENTYKIAHKLKGAAGSLFIDEIYELMAAVEQKAKEGKIEELAKVERVFEYLHLFEKALMENALQYKKENME